MHFEHTPKALANFSPRLERSDNPGFESAKGAKYDSQGLALSGAKRAAPGKQKKNDREALKERNKSR